MKTQIKRQAISVLYIVIAYTIIGILIVLYDHFLLNSFVSKGTVESYQLDEALVYNMGGGFTFGLLSGLFLTTLNRKLRQKPFFYGQILGIIVFLTLFCLIMLSIAFISSYNLVDGNLNDPNLYTAIENRIFTSLHLKNLIVWSIIFPLTQFYLQLQQKFGPGNMYKLFSGKYHTPKIESRIFMFLDLKSSTSIAEKLGESKYHQFLQDVFSDITYKLLPVFKAGAHIGNSIVGEIGIIKRAITYSGDLLNTTARIQGKCNELNSTFLISGQLNTYLDSSVTEWNIQSKGFIPLRGKQSKVELFSVSN